MGVYVDDAELGAYSDAVPAHLKKLTADPDFIGPESYPRRQRDWVGYYVAFVMCFASFVIGVAPPSRTESPSTCSASSEACPRASSVCGADAGVTNEPFLWHPHAGEPRPRLGCGLVCVSRRVRPRTTGYASTPTSRMLSAEARPPRPTRPTSSTTLPCTGRRRLPEPAPDAPKQRVPLRRVPALADGLRAGVPRVPAQGQGEADGARRRNDGR